MNQRIGCPSANFHHGRPFGLRPEAVVVHIMDGSFAAGESVFRDPTTQKSADYGQISSVHDMRAAHGVAAQSVEALHPGRIDLGLESSADRSGPYDAHPRKTIITPNVSINPCARMQTHKFPSDKT